MNTLLLILLAGISTCTAWNLIWSPHEERLQNRRAGDNFLVVCKVKDFDGAASDVKIEWHKEGKLIPRFGSTMTIERTYSNQLMINRPKPSDGGKYTCKADIHGEVQEISAEISFVEPPKFVNPQEEQHPDEGSRAEIICEVEGTEQLEVFWQFNGATLDEASQRGYEFSENRQTLYIPHFNAKKDDGIYNCNAAQYSSFETLSINVTGYARPTITVFDVPSGNRGLEGHTVELKCGAIGKPKPSYKWFFEDDEVAIEHSDKHNVEEGLLIIESLNGDDAGTYKCVANNTVGTDERVVQLAVYLKPKVDVTHEYVKKEGEDVEIVCNYHGEGELSAKFVYGSQEFAVREEKEEPSTFAPESAENSEEETKGDAETTTGTSEKSESGETDADAEAETTPHTTSEEAEETTHADNEKEASEEEDDEQDESKRWKRFVDDVNSNRISVRAEEHKLILTIKQLSLEDAGAYKCLVSNEAGVTNKTSQVNIIHPPTLRHYTGPRIRSHDGNTVTIFCDVSAVPAPKWKWFKDGSEVEANGASVQIDSQATSTKMTLQHEEGSDNYGRYMCKADNGVGVLEKLIEVVHVVRPATPSGMDCKKFIYPNYGRCSFEDGMYDEESTKPLEMQFLIAKMEEMESDFDWDDALSIKINFGNETTIPNLSPSTQYMVKARAINEAGESEYTEETSLETTDPWAPQAPTSVQMECSESCIVSWTAPNDHGSPITNYRITVQEMGHVDSYVETTSQETSTQADNENDEETTTDSDGNSSEKEDIEIEHESNEDTSNEKETTEKPTSAEENSQEDTNNFDYVKKTDIEEKRVPLGNAFVVEVGADETELELTHIKPHSYYKVAVAAINAVGQGELLEIEHQTDESPTKFDQGILTESLYLAAAIGLFFIALVIDFICYLTNKCGVIACVCLNCCGRNPSERKQRDLECGRGGPESNRLLDNSGTR